MGAGRGADGLTAFLRQRTLALAVLAAWVSTGCQRGPDDEYAVKPVLPAPSLEGQKSSGELFRLSQTRGKVVVVTFGYTRCSDVCPMTMSTLCSLEQRLAAKGQSVEVVFVSVDPERDSAQRLSEFMNFFSPRFTALRLEGPALQQVLSAYGIKSEKKFGDALRYSELMEGEPPDYTIYHTGGYFLIDPSGELRLLLPFNVTVERLQASVERLLAESTPVSSMKVERPRARVTPAEVGAVYLKLVNSSWREDRLLGAETASAKRVELHEVQAYENVVGMLPRFEGFAIPAGGSVELSPGGKHLMLYGVAKNTGGIDLNLRFERAGVVPVRVPVLAADQDAR